MGENDTDSEFQLVGYDGKPLWSPPQENEGGLEENAQLIRRQLRPDGPPVDWAAVHLYIADDLSPEECEVVRANIVTWEAWNRAYWETVASLGDKDSK